MEGDTYQSILFIELKVLNNARLIKEEVGGICIFEAILGAMNALTLSFLSLVMLAATSCGDGRRYHDESPAPESLQAGNAIEEALAFRASMDKMFRDPELSPLPDRYRKNFQGLEFFEPDSLYRVRALYVRTPESQPFLMPTTTERRAREVRHGIAYFSLNGADYQLEIYRSAEPEGEQGRENLFLPFLDNTNGQSTYEGGRYIDLDFPAGDSLIIDFNKAYNPYCTYNKKYSCPIVPRVNYLNTEILAGVKAFRKP
jgi:uncharacterized protein